MDWKIVSIAFLVLITGCSNVIKSENYGNYDPFYLAEGQYVKNGNPNTGLGFESRTYSTVLPGKENSVYALEIADSRVIPLRKPEIVRRIYIYPKMVGNIYTEAIRIYGVMRSPEWNEK